MAEPKIQNSLHLIALNTGVFAFDICRELCELDARSKHAKPEILNCLAFLPALLQLLDWVSTRTIDQPEREDFEPLRNPLTCCEAICNVLKEMLVAANQMKPGRARVRNFVYQMRSREKSFDDLKKRLISYKETLNIAFQSLTMYARNRNLCCAKKLTTISTEDWVTHKSLEDLGRMMNKTQYQLEDQLETLSPALSSADASALPALVEDQAMLHSCLEVIAHVRQDAEAALSFTVGECKADKGKRPVYGPDNFQGDTSLTTERLRRLGHPPTFAEFLQAGSAGFALSRPTTFTHTLIDGDQVIEVNNDSPDEHKMRYVIQFFNELRLAYDATPSTESDNSDSSTILEQPDVSVISVPVTPGWRRSTSATFSSDHTTVVNAPTSS
ncbi:hypothetical protein N0V90_013375 [Kalmusia sp. IMI 367209]|nr:hypothetical protein N0V90_013375 [Kalmusia sp. IMI 367209]